MRLDHRYFERAATQQHNGRLLESYKAVHARSTMVLFSRKTRTPLAALTLKAKDAGCLSMLTGRPSPPASGDGCAKQPYFQGMVSMPDQTFAFVISNLSDAGMINFNVLHTPHRVSEVDPGPTYGINEVNELRANQSYEIEADQRTGRAMVLGGKTQVRVDPITKESEVVPLTVDESESAKDKSKEGLYFYLSVVPDIASRELVKKFEEGTVWKAVSGFVRKVAAPRPAPSSFAAGHSSRLGSLNWQRRAIADGLTFPGGTAMQQSLSGHSRNTRGEWPEQNGVGNEDEDVQAGRSRLARGFPPPPAGAAMAPLRSQLSTEQQPPGSGLLESMECHGEESSRMSSRMPSLRRLIGRAESSRGPRLVRSSRAFGSAPARETVQRRSQSFRPEAFSAATSGRSMAAASAGPSRPPEAAPAWRSMNLGDNASDADEFMMHCDFEDDSSVELAGFRMHCGFADGSPVELARSGFAESVDVGTTQAGELAYGERVNVSSSYTGREYAYEHASEPTVLCMSIWEQMKFVPLGDAVEKMLEDEAKEWIENEGKALIESLNAVYKEEKCVIDLESEADTIVCTCGHQCINHANVTNDLKHCPLCRSPVTAFVRADGIVV